MSTIAMLLEMKAKKVAPNQSDAPEGNKAVKHLNKTGKKIADKFSGGKKSVSEDSGRITSWSQYNSLNEDRVIDRLVEMILEDGEGGGDAGGGDGSGAAPSATPIGDSGPTSAPTGPTGPGGPGGGGPSPTGPHPGGPPGPPPSMNGGWGGGNRFANAWFNTFATQLMWLTSAKKIKKRLKDLGIEGEGAKRLSAAVELAKGQVNGLLQNPGWRQQNWTFDSGPGKKQSQKLASGIGKTLGKAIKKHSKKLKENLNEAKHEPITSEDRALLKKVFGNDGNSSFKRGDGSYVLPDNVTLIYKNARLAIVKERGKMNASAGLYADRDDPGGSSTRPLKSIDVDLHDEAAMEKFKKMIDGNKDPK